MQLGQLLPGTGPLLGRSNIVAQFAWYLIVGGLAFAVDLLVFVALLRGGVPVLAASSLSFIAGALANYLLSRLLAFAGGRHSPLGEIARLFVVALIGLGLTTVLVWVIVALLFLPPVMAKVITVPIVLIWNYLARRYFVFGLEMPEVTYRFTATTLHGGGCLRRKPASDLAESLLRARRHGCDRATGR